MSEERDIVFLLLQTRDIAGNEPAHLHRAGSGVGVPWPQTIPSCGISHVRRNGMGRTRADRCWRSGWQPVRNRWARNLCRWDGRLRDDRNLSCVRWKPCRGASRPLSRACAQSVV